MAKLNGHPELTVLALYFESLLEHQSIFPNIGLAQSQLSKTPELDGAHYPHFLMSLTLLVALGPGQRYPHNHDQYNLHGPPIQSRCTATSRVQL